MDVNGTWSNNNSSEEFCFEVPLVKSKSYVQVEFELQASTINTNKAIAIDESKTGLSLTNTQKAIQQYDSKEVVVLDENIYLSELPNERNQNDMANKFEAVNDDNHNTISAKVDASNHEVVDLEDGITDTENVVILDSDKKDQENIVTLNGNRTDSDVILLDGKKTDSESTIILDDDEIRKAAKPTSIFHNKDIDCSIIETSTIKRNRTDFNTIVEEHSLIAQLVKKCISMENARGMTRVIYRTLLPIYQDVKEDYKKSDAIRKVLTKTIMQLDLEPEKKFSHIRNLCDELKSHKVKKRVPFITLEDRVSTDTQSMKRRKIETIIELDEDEDQNDNINTQRPAYTNKPKEYPPIEIDDSSTDEVVNVDDDDIILIENDKENSRKSSRIKHNETKRRQKKRKFTHTKNGTSIRKRNKYYQTKIARLHSDETNHHSNIYAEHLHSEIIRNRYPSEKTVSGNNKIPIPSTSVSESLVVPLIVEENDRIAAELNMKRVQSLEIKIADLKVKLEKLEETEVISDNIWSPYLICEQIKSKILSLYKQLCQLTSTEMTKRHEVRLQVVPGHPEGPIRCLEEFLNSNIDEDGNPPFPDMYDVIMCVNKANIQYNMNWGAKEILAEARALFTQYGRSMQKRRQKREYRDLMSLVKEELPDPAEGDSELQARLERNKHIGLWNENALLERYSQMESGIPDPRLRLSMQQGDSDDNSETENDITSNTALEGPHQHQIGLLNPIGVCERTTDLVPDRVTSMNQVEPRPNFVSAGVVPSMNQFEARPNFIPGCVTSMSQGEPNGTPRETNSGVTSGLQNVNQTITSPFVRIDAINMNQFPSFITIPVMNTVQPISGVIMNMNQFAPGAEVGCYNQTGFINGLTVNVNQFTPAGGMHMNQVLPKGIDMSANQVVYPGGIGSMHQGEHIGAGRPTDPMPSGVTFNPNVGLMVGSSLTVAGGKIVIQPAIRNANDAAPVHAGSEICLFTGEHRSIRLENEKRNANALANDIDNLVCNGPSDNANSFANVVISNVKSVNCLTESASDASDVSQNDKTQTHGLQKTNTVSVPSISENAETIIENIAISEKENKTNLGIDTYLENEESITKSEQLDDIDPEEPKDRNNSTTEERVDIVKAEPLDIPSMLEELGDDYTATVFDIEDPFLVIEVSDSSESEEDE